MTLLRGILNTIIRIPLAAMNMDLMWNMKYPTTKSTANTAHV